LHFLLTFVDFPPCLDLSAHRQKSS
jgi:hypothetical protein